MGKYVGELKCNQRSVRMTDTVYEYVMQSEGESFNQKFENMVLYAAEEKEKLQKEIGLLQEQINFLRQSRTSLVDELRLGELKNIAKNMQEVFEKLESVDL